MLSEILDYTKRSAADAVKTTSKKSNSNTAETTDD